MKRDTLGHRAKLGVIVPSTNTSVEPELAKMAPVGVTNHLGRMKIENMPLNNDEDFAALIAALVESMDSAVESVMSAQPDHLVLGLSAETFWDGVEAGRAETDALRKKYDIGVSSVAETLVDALNEFGLKKIAVLTPYQAIGDARVQSFFEASGIEVVALKGLRCASPVDIAMISRRELAQSLGELAKSGADALVQVGTNLPMAQVASEAFDWLGLPVLAANTVLYRDALRQLGLLDDASFRAQWMPFDA